MIKESVCIIVLIGIITILFLRDRRTDCAKLTSVLMIVPLSNLLAALLAKPLSSIKNVERLDIRIVGIVLGLIVSCLLLGLFSNHIQKKRFRTVYLAINGLFVAVLSLIFIYNIVLAPTP